MPNLLEPVILEIINGNQQLSIPILDQSANIVGCLAPLSSIYLDQPEVIAKLTIWRNKNMACFFSQFVATPERTRNWISNVLFATSTQMLFLILVHDQIVGHLGFKNLTATDALLDNVIRGSRFGHPRLFVFAGIALIKWLFKTAELQRIYAQVMTDNPTAIMMNKDIGFRDWKRYPLLKNNAENEIAWEIGSADEISPEGRYCFKPVIEPNYIQTF